MKVGNHMIKKRLKELRNEKKLFQKDLAELLDVALTTYASYEQGLTRPPLESLVVLAKYYNVSTDYLLGITDIKYNQDELDFFNELKEKDLEQLIREYNLTLGDDALDEKEERILIKLIKSFMEEKD